MFLMVGAEWCDKCQQVKKILKDRGLWDQVEYIDADKPEGRVQLVRWGTDKVPFFIVNGKKLNHAGEFLHLLTEAGLEQKLQPGDINKGETE